MNDLPLVSICMPVYNGARYIDESLPCCLNQTYPNIEIIVSDNCSTDDTLDRIRRYDDPRIRIHSNPRNEGMIYNFRKTLTHAAGKYMSFLCADDGMERDAIEKAVAILEAPGNEGVVLVGSSVGVIDERGRRLLTKKFMFGGGRCSAFRALRSNFIYGSNALGELNAAVWRRSAYDRIPEPKMRNGNLWTVDLDLKCELLLQGDAWFIPEALARFRVSSQSTSRKELTFRQAKLFREYALALYRDGRYRLSFFWVILATMTSFLLEVARHAFYLLFLRGRS